MTDHTSAAFNKKYIFGVSTITFLLPVISALVELWNANGQSFSLALIGKWFIFYAVGLRLFIAGIRQTTNPAFTAKEIFHIDSPDSFPILRELGFANLCFGLVGLMSLFLPLSPLRFDMTIEPGKDHNLFFYPFPNNMRLRRPKGQHQRIFH